jgi:hypothetical protein
LIGLFGHGQLTVTTKAFDEAGTRVSRQLLMQSLVNLVYGIAAGMGSMPSACLVGRWSPRALADDSTQLLRDAGATLVASALMETWTYLGGLVEIPRVPLPASGVLAA